MVSYFWRAIPPYRWAVEGKKELLTIPEAAAELGKTRATVWRYVRRGDLNLEIDHGRHKLIDREELERFRTTLKPPGRPRAQT